MICLESQSFQVGSESAKTVTCNRNDLHVWHRGHLRDSRGEIVASVEWSHETSRLLSPDDRLEILRLGLTALREHVQRELEVGEPFEDIANRLDEMTDAAWPDSSVRQAR